MESAEFCPFAVIQLGKTAFAGFLETVIQVYTGFLHGTAHHIIADVAGSGKEITEVAGIHGADGGNRIPLDAGNLHQTADGIAGQTQMALSSRLWALKPL